jgi:hypothetical protein
VRETASLPAVMRRSAKGGHRRRVQLAKIISSTVMRMKMRSHGLKPANVQNLKIIQVRSREFAAHPGAIPIKAITFIQVRRTPKKIAELRKT